MASAAEAIARNPGAAGEIRGALILGLVLIESLVIYVLLISLDSVLPQSVRLGSSELKVTGVKIDGGEANRLRPVSFLH